MGELPELTSNQITKIQNRIILGVTIYFASHLICIATLLPSAKTEHDPSVVLSMIEQGMVATPNADDGFGGFDIITPLGDH